LVASHIQAGLHYASLAAAFWLAERASMRSSSTGLSPGLTRGETMALGTWADSVVWRTASTTASRLIHGRASARRLNHHGGERLFSAARWARRSTAGQGCDGQQDFWDIIQISKAF
jgi:hypothetical protein